MAQTKRPGTISQLKRENAKLRARLAQLETRRRASQPASIRTRRSHFDPLLPAINQYPGVLVLYDPERRFEFANSIATQIAGEFAKNLIGHRDEELFPATITRAYLPFLQRAIETRTPQSGEFTVTLSSGTYSVKVTYVPLLDDKDNLRQVLGITQDISKQISAERAVRELEERFGKAFHASPVASVISHLDDGTIVDVNDSFLAVFGYTREELIGRNASETGLWVHPEERAKLVAEIRSEHPVRRMPVAGRNKAGKELYVLLSAEKIEIGGVECLITLLDDVTERKRVEEQIRQRDEQFRALADYTPDVVVRLGRDLRMTYVNPTASRLTGLPADNFVGKTFEEMRVPHRLIPLWAEKVNWVFDHGQTTMMEFEYPTIQGPQIFETQLVPEFDSEGHVTHVLTVSRDITERTHTKQQLEERVRERTAELETERARWQSVVQGIADEVWVCDAQGQMSILNLPDSNSASLKLFKDKTIDQIYTEFEILNADGQPRPSDDAPLLRSLRGETVRGEEIIRNRQTGKTQHRQFSSAPTHDASGKITGAVAIVRDVTAHKQMEDALRQHMQQFEFLAESGLRLLQMTPEDDLLGFIGQQVQMLAGDAIVGVSAYDAATNQLVVRSLFCAPEERERLRQILGLDPVGVGFTVTDKYKQRIFIAGLQPVPDRLYGLSFEQLALEASRELEQALNIQSVYATPFAVGEDLLGTVAILSHQPELPETARVIEAFLNQAAMAVQRAKVVEQLQEAMDHVQVLNRELEQRAIELQVANKELESFSFSVSHDLRAPLATLDILSMTLLEEFANGRLEAVQKYLGSIQKNVKAMDNLIKALLRFSQTAREPVQRMRVSVAKLVRETLDILEAERDGRQIEIVIGQLREANADPILLKQVLANLLSNALKFTRKRQVARIEIGSYEEDGQMIYYIKDNGVGFDLDHADKLFGVFQRYHDEEEYEGTGIGLALVERIIRRHGGWVCAEAQIDQGATFFFTLA